MIKDNIHDIHTQTPLYQAPPYDSTNILPLTLTEYKMVINETKQKSALERHEHTSKNSDIGALCSLSKEMLK